MISRRKLLLAVLAAVTAAPSGSDTSGRMVLLSGIEILAAVVARRLQRQRERNRERWTRCREKRGGYTRRRITRADGEWPASTMSGYVSLDQYDDVYAKNFRVSRATFDVLLGQLQRGGCLRDNQSRNPLHQVPGRFKLGVCLYFFAQGTGWKAAADCASIGETTVRTYVEDFMDGVVRVLRPIYMPPKPPDAASLVAIRSEFASRRGVWNIAMAVDGSHVPFRPPTEDANDYRNYKGWHSILVVAFVTAYYLFVDADVGAPGRSGDNTVLENSWLLSMITQNRDAWLGPGGMIAADGGASDKGQLLLNPYRCPTEPDQLYFNFCHSSTRFYVEETFGRWKNRFRFLLKQGDYTHKTLVRMVYCSLILHNACTIHKDNAVSMDVGNDAEWAEFHKAFASNMCPKCKARKAAHCVHVAQNRSAVRRGDGAKGSSKEQRDAMKMALYAAYMASGDAQAGDGCVFQSEYRD